MASPPLRDTVTHLEDSLDVGGEDSEFGVDGVADPLDDDVLRESSVYGGLSALHLDQP